MKTKITTALFVAALAAGTVSAQAPAGASRDAFLKQQAVAEMRRSFPTVSARRRR